MCVLLSAGLRSRKGFCMSKSFDEGQTDCARLDILKCVGIVTADATRKDTSLICNIINKAVGSPRVISYPRVQVGLRIAGIVLTLRSSCEFADTIADVACQDPYESLHVTGERKFFIQREVS